MSEVPDSGLRCGKTIEELSAYLDAGREPYDPSIETCPECLNALDTLARVGQLSRSLVAQDATALPEPPASWFRSIIATVESELRPGRDLPIYHPDPSVRISVTEGAVRHLLRSVVDEIGGVIVGRTEIIGDAEQPGAPVEIELTITVAWGHPIAPTVELVRERVYEAVAQHTELHVTGVNITVEDVHEVTETRGTAGPAGTEGKIVEGEGDEA